jgi:hypothetical protein
MEVSVGEESQNLEDTGSTASAQLAASITAFLSDSLHCFFVSGDQNADPSGSSILGVLGPTYHHGSHHQVQSTFIYTHGLHTPCNFQTLTLHSRLHESFHLFIYVQKFPPLLTTSITENGVQEES